MLPSLLLAAALLAGAQPGLTPAFQAALELANQGQHEQALTAFQRLAAENPNDLESRIWIARLHERMGNFDRAEPVYRSVLLEVPDHAAAALGTGKMLIELDRLDEAIKMLERAEMLEPDSVEVQLALGRAHAVAGHTRQAAVHYRQGADRAPFVENLVAADRAELADSHQLSLRYSNERFSDSAPTTHLGELGVNFRLADSLRLFGRAQYQDKFNFSETRGGAGATVIIGGATAFTAQALIGPNDSRVLPWRDYLAEASYTYHLRTASGFVRHYVFRSDTMTVLSPAASMWIGSRLWLGVRYAASLTERAGGVDREIGHTGHIRGTLQLQPRLAVNLGFARGVDDFDNLSIDRVGKFVATTGSAGVRYELRQMSVTGTFEYQRPHAGRSMQRATVTLTRGF